MPSVIRYVLSTQKACGQTNLLRDSYRPEKTYVVNKAKEAVVNTVAAVVHEQRNLRRTLKLSFAPKLTVLRFTGRFSIGFQKTFDVNYSI